jgi:sugar/nucleoside kinase (ribokinase family)
VVYAPRRAASVPLPTPGPMTPPTAVLCAGNFVYDVLVRPIENLTWGTTVWVETLAPSMGGNGANTSFALGRMSVPVRALGAVGTDTFGDFVLARLAQSNVDTSRLQRLPGQTASTVGLVRADGERTFFHLPGVSREVFRDGLTLDTALCAGFSHFHLANVFSMPGLRSHAAAVLHAAHAAGLTVSLDTGWDGAGEWLPVIEGGLGAVHLMFVNQSEAAMITGFEAPSDSARFLLERGVGQVVMKLGARGCVLYGGSEGAVAVPGFRVEALDTTGAGDVFAGGFLAALHHGLSFPDAARYANAVGALNVEQVGATSGVRSWQETLAWMRERE